MDTFPDRPLVSIITASYNSAATINDTLYSIAIQDYPRIEHIIVDGLSSDNTVHIIGSFKHVSKIISEKDNGIYDAMNKGVDRASSKYLNFMNSDDYFFSNTIIEEVAPLFNSEYEIIYGNTEIRYKDFKSIKIWGKPAHIWMGPVNHQSSFIKTEIMKKYKYNVSNKIVADFEFFLNVYYHGGKIIKINNIIASYSNEGISQQKEVQVIEDIYNTVKKFKKGIIVDIYYNILKIKPLIKKLLPRRIFKLIVSKK